jgi:hypothetical protein
MLCRIRFSLLALRHRAGIRSNCLRIRSCITFTIRFLLYTSLGYSELPASPTEKATTAIERLTAALGRQGLRTIAVFADTKGIQGPAAPVTSKKRRSRSSAPRDRRRLLAGSGPDRICYRQLVIVVKATAIRADMILNGGATRIRVPLPRKFSLDAGHGLQPKDENMKAFVALLVAPLVTCLDPQSCS